MARRIADLLVLIGLAALAGGCGGSGEVAPASQSPPATAPATDPLMLGVGEPPAGTDAGAASAVEPAVVEGTAPVSEETVAGEGEGAAPATDEPAVETGDETIAPPP